MMEMGRLMGCGTNSTVGDDALIVPRQAEEIREIRCGVVRCCVSTLDFRNLVVRPVVTPGGVTLRRLWNNILFHIGFMVFYRCILWDGRPVPYDENVRFFVYLT